MPEPLYEIEPSIARLLRFDRITPDDLPAAVRLSSQVGWNQIEADWRRALELNPQSAIAARIDGALVGTAVLVRYRSGLDWVGLVIVDGAFRGRGIGRALFREAVRRSTDSKLVALDATDVGRSVYLKYGFVDVMPVERWSGSLRSPNAGEAERCLSAKELARILDHDAAVTGVDRGSLLRNLFNDEAVAAWSVPSVERNGLGGFAFLRPGRTHWQLGPLLAENEEALVALLSAAARRLDAAPVLADAAGTGPATRVLREYGLNLQRRLTRMTFPEARPAFSGPGICLGAGLEWG